MRKLIRGIVEYRAKVRPGYRRVFARLALRQKPDALLVACSDSRVAPNLFASTQPGDLFVVRNVGNTVPVWCGGGPSEAAAVDFAVRVLKVRDVIVCGHSSCGAMRALLSARRPSRALGAWLAHAAPALRRLDGGAHPDASLSKGDRLSQVNVLLQLEHLRTHPAVARAAARGRLRLHAWWFDIARAEVLHYDPAIARFVPIDAREARRLLVLLHGSRKPVR